MANFLPIITNSLRLTLQELKVNKLRTGLSLTGIAFGIFCIIGVLATVNSLERNIQDEVKSLGINTIFIDKWEYGSGPDRPFWKYRQRPAMKYEEAGYLKQRSQLGDDFAFLMRDFGNKSYGNNSISGGIMGITASQMNIEPIKILAGRFFTQAEFASGANVAIIGYEDADALFGSPTIALGKPMQVKGKQVTIVGVIAKKGQTMVGWNYDNSIMLPYYFSIKLADPKQSNPVIVAKGKEGVSTDAFIGELRGVLRQIRRLGPTQEDNFSLNSVEAFGKMISSFFVVINIVGSIIGGISLIVGLFGIANIMFVTVKERTPVIGLKKAIGAKRSSILTEFLLEAVILSLAGGAIGLLLVFIGLYIFSKVQDFPFFISIPMLLFSIALCVIVGVIAGIIPAAKAGRLDPVTAIRS